ncbi:MAG: tetratricopeptide repeat protein, partial [Phormidesmis sp.]
MAPSEWQSAMRKDTIKADKSGTIDEVSQRLLLWAKRDGGGLARVEYASEFSREQLLQRLSGEGVELIEIDLPASQTAAAAVEFLLGRLAEVSGVATERPGEGNVVSVSGFAEAFQSQMSLADSLRILNFNRESLTAFPLRQIWWMTPVLLETSLHAMPDMHGWFNPQLSLSEVITRSAEDLFAATPIQIERRLSQSNIDDARQRSRRLLAELEAARGSGAEEVALVTTYLLPALEAIAQAGARQELKALTTQHKALLNHFYSMNNAEVLAALSSGEVAGEKALSFARSLDKLVEVFYKQGLYAEAERLCIRALEIKKSKLGDRHPDTAQGLNNLALLYYLQGRYGEAEPLSVEALEIRKAALGDRHPDTATSLNNLAALYRSQGRYGEAEPLYVEALEIRKAELGDRHSSTATSLNNLALLYKSQGRYG